jgi:hypothetical protein
VHHRRLGRGAMPVLLVRRDPDGVARHDRAKGTTAALNAAYSKQHVQGLPKRMLVPSGSSSGLERQAHRVHTRRSRSLNDPVEPPRARSPVVG